MFRSRPPANLFPLLLLLAVFALLLAGCGGDDAVEPAEILPSPAAGGPASPTIDANAEPAAVPTPGRLVPTQPPAPTATATWIVRAILPAPLYFRAVNGQIRLLERDGETLRQITGEPTAVSDFDVSPADGTVVYAAGGKLYRSNAFGRDRVVLVDASTAELDAPASNSPRISPDGRQVVFAADGLYRLPVAGGEPELLLAADPPGPGAGRYTPISWSPDGKKLLLTYDFYTQGAQLRVLEMVTGELAVLDAGCCHPAWTPDSRQIYVSGSFYGPRGRPGLRFYDATSGAETVLAQQETADSLPLYAYVRPLDQGELLGFFRSTDNREYNRLAGALDFFMQRTALDGVTDRRLLREDSYQLRDVLWAPDGSGAVIADGGVSAERPVLRWLPAAGGVAVELPARLMPLPGSALRWGELAVSPK